MRRKITLAIFGSILALSACGRTTGEQALLGGGAGAGVAFVAGVSVLGGALVGAGANVYCQQYSSAC